MSRQVLNEPEVKVYCCRRNLVTIKCASTLVLTVGTGNKKGEKGAGCFEINLFLSLLNLTRSTGRFFFTRKKLSAFRVLKPKSISVEV